MRNVTFRTAEPKDALAVARLHHVTRETSMTYLPVLHSLDEGIVSFSTVIDQRNVLVAEIEGDIVGYCAYGDGWLDHLYVYPDLQGQGIGSELLNRAITTDGSLQLWVFQKSLGAI